MVFYLEFVVKASIHIFLGNPMSIKVAKLFREAAKALEFSTARIGFPLEKREHMLINTNINIFHSIFPLATCLITT